MKRETKKYVKKREQIIKIIESINAIYEDDEIRVSASPDFQQSKEAAEKILSKVGINMPSELSEIETRGYSIMP